MESLQNVVVTHFQVTPFFFNENSIASVIIVDAYAWCKQTLSEYGACSVPLRFFLLNNFVENGIYNVHGFVTD